MKNKLICILLALVLLVGLSLPAMATQATYIYDQLDYFYDYEEDDLSQTCADIADQYGVGVYYATVEEALDSVEASTIVGNAQDYILFLENQEEWNVFYGGSAAQYMNDDRVSDLFAIYEDEISQKAAANACILAAEKLIAQNAGGQQDSSEPVVTGTQAVVARVVDEPDLLSNEEEAALLANMETVRKAYQVDLAVYIAETIDGESIEEVANATYDYAGLGLGDTKAGVLLLVAMEEGEYYILTNGFAHTAITDSEAAAIGSEVASYLTKEDYAAGFEVFVEQCGYEIDGELNGFPFRFGRNLLIALGVGLLLAFIVTGSWKSKLKSVRQQKNATVYTKQGSMNITLANDFYLYSTVARKAKPQKSGSSSGGSGGSSRGGAGGSF